MEICIVESMTTNAENPTTRFAVVGTGQIAQQAFIPGLKQLPEAELAAIVSSDPAKGDAYGVPGYSYDQYAELLKSGDIDAAYVATPVHQHLDYTVPALEAGLPVLCEKPMAPSIEDCQTMIDTAERTGTPLMLAYRMHSDPFMTDLVELANSGKLGELHSFTASFGHMINPDNHRGKEGFWAGPVPDLGVYPLNFIRNIYGEEPTTVHAIGVEHRGSELEVTPTVAVTLGFASGRLAQFTSSYATCSQQGFTLSGTEGYVQSAAAFQWGDGAPLSYTVDLGEGPEDKEYSAKDQFAGETRYFLQCIRDGVQPEPDGTEGLMDIRVCEAVQRSLETGEVQTLEKIEPTRPITSAQAVSIPAPPKPEVSELVGIEPEEQ